MRRFLCINKRKTKEIKLLVRKHHYNCRSIYHGLRTLQTLFMRYWFWLSKKLNRLSIIFNAKNMVCSYNGIFKTIFLGEKSVFGFLVVVGGNPPISLRINIHCTSRFRFYEHDDNYFRPKSLAFHFQSCYLIKIYCCWFYLADLWRSFE